jgi:hypothetical protein
MATSSTAKLGLVKPTPGTGEAVDVQAHLNDNWDKLDFTSGFTICTSGARPADPFDGQLIYETDTGQAYAAYDGDWYQLLIEAADFFDFIRMSRPAGGDWAIVTKADGDANRRFILTAAGGIQWGNGTASPDTNLYRGSGGNQLRTDDNFRAASLTIDGDATIDGLFTASNIAVSGVDISPAGTNQVTTVTWNYGKTLPSPVRVLATANTTLPGSVVQEVSISSPGTTSCNVSMYRTSSTTTTIQCLAIGGLG